jgi:TPR repeat protein
MAFCCRYGRGMEADLAQAVAWYRKSAESGNAIAQYWLGECYAEGVGVAKDEKLAVEWRGRAAAKFLRSAEKGDVEAQECIAECHEKGHGVPQDAAEARKWYQRAADNGSENARKWLAEHEAKP